MNCQQYGTDGGDWEGVEEERDFSFPTEMAACSKISDDGDCAKECRGIANQRDRSRSSILDCEDGAEHADEGAPCLPTVGVNAHTYHCGDDDEWMSGDEQKAMGQ